MMTMPPSPPPPPPLDDQALVVAGVVASMLEDVVCSVSLLTDDDDDDDDNGGVPASAFDFPNGSVPSVTLCRYVCERFARRTHASAEVYLLAAIFVDRIARAGLPTMPNNVHRLFAACFVVAVKLQDDRYYSNRFYSRVAGVPLEELNALELAALRILNFSLFVSQEEWLKYAMPLGLLLLPRPAPSVMTINRDAKQQQQQQQQPPPGQQQQQQQHSSHRRGALSFQSQSSSSSSSSMRRV
jgi:hypothetical protein